MPLFDYTALDSTGRKTAGTVSAPGRSAALDEVVGRGFTPVTVTGHDRARTPPDGPGLRIISAGAGAAPIGST